MTSDRLSEEELRRLERKFLKVDPGSLMHWRGLTFDLVAGLALLSEARASREEIARLKSDISDYAEATTQQNAELDRVRAERDEAFSQVIAGARAQEARRQTEASVAAASAACNEYARAQAAEAAISLAQEERDGLAEAARGVKLSAYPAHGSGFVAVVESGWDELQKALSRRPHRSYMLSAK